MNLQIAPPAVDLPPKQPESISHPPPLLLAGAQSAGPLVLALEGLDTLDRSRAGSLHTALGTAAGLAGVFVVIVRQNELLCPTSSALNNLMAGLETSLAWRVDGVVGVLPQRRLIVVVVSEFESGQVEEADVKGFVMGYLDGVYDRFDLPSGMAGSAFADLFDVRLVCIPGERVDADGYDKGVADLGHLLKESSKEYVDAGMTVQGLVQTVERIDRFFAGQDEKNLPEDDELRGSFGCNLVMQAVLDKYRNTARQWKSTVEGGRIIRHFGRECDKLIDETLKVFEKDAAMHRESRAFARKKDELRSLMLSDCYLLFVKQTQKLREVAYQVFRGKLARIRINDQVEKNVRGAVKEAEEYFVENAESLRSNLGGWRFDNERHELVTHMREDATERLQLARLQGNYVPPVRAPIGFAFHTLLLAPFGRDSRITYPQTQDMQQKFDPDKVKQASMMRLRPKQRRGMTWKVGSDKEVNGGDFLDTFQDLFEDPGQK